MIRSSCFYILLTILFIPSFSYARLPIEEMKSSTVRIVCENGYKGTGSGTGVFVGSGEYVVTNHHVISCVEEGGDVLVIRNKEQWHEASVQWSSEKKDLALLSLDYVSGGTVPSIATSDMVHDADTVYVLGFPGAADRSEDILYQVKTTKGIISLKSEIDGVGIYQTDAPINFGNSGGPLFNEYGHLIGINFSKGAGEYVEGIGYAIQIDEILPVLNKYSINYKIVGSATVTEPPVKVQPTSPPLPNRDRSSSLDFDDDYTYVYISLIGGLLLGGIAFLLMSRGRKTSHDKIKRQRTNSQNKNVSRPVLYGVSGPFAGKEFRLANHSVAIGRDPGKCQVVFPSVSKDIGRLHCAIRFDSGSNSFILTDCQSTNGTFLGDGRRLEAGASCQMTSGARFSLSSSENLFEVRLI